MAPVQGKKLSVVGVFLLLSIVALVIVMGSGITYYATVTFPHEQHIQKTAITTSLIATQAKSTAQAHLQASATASAMTPEQIYAQATSGIPVINDSLTGIENGIWYPLYSSPNGCYYSAGAYHLVLATSNFSYACTGINTLFGNLAFQVQITINRGELGGLIFHQRNYDGYLFGITSDGKYVLALIKNSTSTQLTGGVDTNARPGTGQTNLLSIVALDGYIYLYINKQPVGRVFDNTFDKGQLAFYGEGGSGPTDIAFSNAEAWGL